MNDIPGEIKQFLFSKSSWHLVSKCEVRKLFGESPLRICRTFHKMINKISMITVVVKDQDEALKWYTEKLGFEKMSDDSWGEGFRWITVAAPKQKDVRITLASSKWYGGGSGDQVGKNTTVVLDSDDCKKDYELLKARGVEFTDPPTEETYGISAVFLDLYGNPYNVVERRGVR